MIENALLGDEASGNRLVPEKIVFWYRLLACGGCFNPKIILQISHPDMFCMNPTPILIMLTSQICLMQARICETNHWWHLQYIKLSQHAIWLMLLDQMKINQWTHISPHRLTTTISKRKRCNNVERVRCPIHLLKPTTTKIKRNLSNKQ